MFGKPPRPRPPLPSNTAPTKLAAPKLAHADDASRGPKAEPPEESKWAMQCKLDAARSISYRESLIMQLNALVVNWPSEATRLTDAVRLLANLSKELREAGLLCVEKVFIFSLIKQQHTKHHF